MCVYLSIYTMYFSNQMKHHLFRVSGVSVIREGERDGGGMLWSE